MSVPCSALLPLYLVAGIAVFKAPPDNAGARSVMPSRGAPGA
jgi:hypothetical protein